MAAPTLIRRELKNVRFYFIPAGEIVDTVTVAKETWPDNVPTTNYTAYQWPDVETLKLEKTVKEEIIQIPADEGGYMDDPEEMTTMRKWTGVTAKTNNIIKQLDNGLAAVVADNVAQAPDQVSDNYKEGISLIEVQGKNGTMIERRQMWSRVRIKTTGDAAPTTAKVEFTVERRPSSLNTYIAFAG